MLKGIVDKFRDKFYIWNPVTLNEKEKTVLDILPDREEVRESGVPPITTKEAMNRASENHDIKSGTARDKMYNLKKMGVAEKTGDGWIGKGRMHKKLSEEKLMKFFVTCGFVCIMGGLTFDIFPLIYVAVFNFIVVFLFFL
jgi:hypothetical protein